MENNSTEVAIFKDEKTEIKIAILNQPSYDQSSPLEIIMFSPKKEKHITVEKYDIRIQAKSPEKEIAPNSEWVSDIGEEDSYRPLKNIIDANSISPYKDLSYSINSIFNFMERTNQNRLLKYFQKKFIEISVSITLFDRLLNIQLIIDKTLMVKHKNKIYLVKQRMC